MPRDFGIRVSDLGRKSWFGAALQSQREAAAKVGPGKAPGIGCKSRKKGTGLSRCRETCLMIPQAPAAHSSLWHQAAR